MKKPFELNLFSQSLKNLNSKQESIDLYFTQEEVQSNLFLKTLFKNYSSRTLYINDNILNNLKTAIENNNSRNVLQTFNEIPLSIKCMRDIDSLTYIQSTLEINVLKELLKELFPQYKCEEINNEILIRTSIDKSRIIFWNDIIVTISKLPLHDIFSNITKKEIDPIDIKDTNNLQNYKNILELFSKNLENNLNYVNELINMFKKASLEERQIIAKNYFEKEYFFLDNVDPFSIKYISINNKFKDILVGKCTINEKEYYISISAIRFINIFMLNSTNLDKLFPIKESVKYLQDIDLLFY